MAIFNEEELKGIFDDAVKAWEDRGAKVEESIVTFSTSGNYHHAIFTIKKEYTKNGRITVEEKKYSILVQVKSLGDKFSKQAVYRNYFTNDEKSRLKDENYFFNENIDYLYYNFAELGYLADFSVFREKIKSTTYYRVYKESGADNFNSTLSKNKTIDELLEMLTKYDPNEGAAFFKTTYLNE